MLYKSSLINNAEHTIDQMNKRLEVLKVIDVGYIYTFCNSSQNSNILGWYWEYLGRCRGFNTDSVRFDVYACTQDITFRLDMSSQNFTSLTKIVKVDVKDLPLYINSDKWKWKSQLFLDILAGKRKIRIPKE
jgi:hypothetical protein